MSRIRSRRHRQPQPDVGSLRTVHGGQLPTVGQGDLPGDRQAQAGSASSPLTAGVQADEAFEDPFAVGGGNPGPVVDDVDDGSSVPSVETQLDPRGRVAGGVVGEVAQHPGQVVSVAQYSDRHGASGDLQSGDPPQPPCLGGHQVVEVDLLKSHPDAALVGAGQEQQVVHQPLETVNLGQYIGADRSRIAGLGVRGGDLVCGPDGGQRTAQFV